MLQNGQQHGLEIDSEVLSTYAAANGLDQIQDYGMFCGEFLLSGVVSSLATRD